MASQEEHCGISELVHHDHLYNLIVKDFSSIPLSQDVPLPSSKEIPCKQASNSSRLEVQNPKQIKGASTSQCSPQLRPIVPSKILMKPTYTLKTVGNAAILQSSLQKPTVKYLLQNNIPESMGNLSKDGTKLLLPSSLPYRPLRRSIQPVSVANTSTDNIGSNVNLNSVCPPSSVQMTSKEDDAKILSLVQKKYVPFLKLLIPFLEKNKKGTPENVSMLKTVYTILTTGSAVEKLETFRANETKLQNWYNMAKKDKDENPSIETIDISDEAEGFTPKGNTLSTTKVNTLVLQNRLRKYQHTGLNWLITMYEMKMNGILADEMGLGKKIQTICFLAHLAFEKGIWGPHLIVVPISVVLNWEMEFKKWHPGLKILSYYGDDEERKSKRIGWTKQNAFHVCITSYNRVLEDDLLFKQKKWKYLILDEGHINNFKSQRFQKLLNFGSSHHLFLTRTPLPNNLMELWTLMHFLMPDLFQSQQYLKEGFGNPLTGIIEGSQEYNESLIKRLHKVLRPFMLRRQKCEVEKELPKKYEHVIMCELSKRQRYFYDDFLSQTKTQETIATGNFLSVLTILMQLRKVCNHPNMFEERPTVLSFLMEGITYQTASLAYEALQYDPDKHVSLHFLNLWLADLEIILTGFAAQHVKRLQPPSKLIIEIDDMPDPPPPCPEMDMDFPGPEMDMDFPGQLSPPTVNPLSVVRQTVDVLEEEMYTRKLIHPGIEPAVSAELNGNHTSTSLFEKRQKLHKEKLAPLDIINMQHCVADPVFGHDLVDTISTFHKLQPLYPFKHKWGSYINSESPNFSGENSLHQNVAKALIDCIKTSAERIIVLMDIIKRFVFVVPAVSSPSIKLHMSHPASSHFNKEQTKIKVLENNLTSVAAFFYPISRNMKVQLPELHLIQYDCGKLQKLASLLIDLKNNHHRVLIFTQMTEILDILEQFLNYHGHTYLRLDDNIKVKQIKVLMKCFNANHEIYCLISSTRSRGVRVNLTGADTVIFYDTDWNPTMNAQAQDRRRRISQTKGIHIYRLISKQTIEENILKRANQETLLEDVVIEGENVNCAVFTKDAIEDLFGIEVKEDTLKPGNELNTIKGGVENFSPLQLEKALRMVEHEMAAKAAYAEGADKLVVFNESVHLESKEKMSAEVEIEKLMATLKPIERYGVRFLESQQNNAAEKSGFAEDLRLQKVTIEKGSGKRR